MSEKVEFKSLGVKIDRPDIKQLFLDGIKENLQMFADHYLSTFDNTVENDYTFTERVMEEGCILGFIDFVNSECVKSSDIIEDN